MMTNSQPTSPYIKLYVELEVRDKDNKIIDRRAFESRSWVANILRALRGLMLGGANNARSNVILVTNASQAYPAITNVSDPVLSVNAPSAQAGYGIVIGTGTKPVSIDDFQLAGKIDHGTGAGQMLYQDTSIGNLVYEGTNTVSITITRSFVNNSGASITVNEVGLQANHVGYVFLIARDLVSPGVSVPNGATLTVSYKITATA